MQEIESAADRQTEEQTEAQTEIQTEIQTENKPETQPERRRKNGNKFIKFIKKNAVCCIAFCLAQIGRAHV